MAEDSARQRDSRSLGQSAACQHTPSLPRGQQLPEAMIPRAKTEFQVVAIRGTLVRVRMRRLEYRDGRLVRSRDVT